MELVFVFVYYKLETKEIKVLSSDSARSNNDNLLKNGWKHTATLDPCKWLEYLFNNTEGEDTISKIYELSINKFMSTSVVV